MTIANLKRNLTILTLTCVALAGCDKASAPDDGADDGSEETEGAGEETTAGESSNLSCKEPGASRDCTTEDGEQGVQFCDDSYASGAEVLQWHECLTSIVCTPGDSNDCGIPGGGGGDGSTGEDPGSTIWEHCGLYGGVPDWDTNQDEWGGCNTPLVLSFDGQPARMTAAGAATFDLDGVGGCITTDWPGAATPWLALDRDGNGSIDSGRELFGSGTRLSNGRRAPHGFAALADLDDNGDGRIDLHDEAFGQLVLWGDHDGDRRSTFAETELLAHRQILGIELGYRIDRQCDDRGNCGVERASFRFIDEHGAVRTGEVVDLHLACH